MTSPTLHPMPQLRDVFAEQVRVVAFTLRLPAIAAATLVGVGTLFVLIEFLNDGRGVDFDPASQLLPGAAAVLLPIALWTRDDRFGDGFFRTLPVEHRRHALTRVAAGWVCLMTAIALFTFWQLALAILTGGNVLEAETIRLIPSSAHAQPTGVELDSLITARRTVQPLLWLAPFTGATGAYLLSSAVALGVRRPLRWIVGIVLVFVLGGNLVSELLLAAEARALALAPSQLFDAVLHGPYGLDALLTGRSESLRTQLVLETGERATVWRGLPRLGEWAIATLLWVAAGSLALFGAAYRHREHRRT